MTETEVLIVGGGPAGLSMAALLGRFGVDCVLVERRAEVNPHPRARSVNVRTGELFRQWGILDDVIAVSLPEEWTRQFVYTETLAGREIGRTQMSVQPIVDGVEVSPAPWLLSSQDQIEPIIARCAAAHSGVEIRWGSELVDLAVGDDSVRATVRDRVSGTESTVEASWVVGADGAGSVVRRALGIEMRGETDLATLVNCHFYSDLGRWTDDRPAALYWTTAPARNVFQKIDTHDRWLCQIGYDPRQHRPEDFDVDTAADWIRRSIGDESADVHVLAVIPWAMSSTVAESFRVDRAFLIGDAAHQLPPSGGFGMNTAVQDAHALAWRLAFVTGGLAGDALLDSFHVERAPIARYNADRSLDNTRSVGRIRKLVEGGGGTAAERDAIAASGRYGNWLGMDLGLHYPQGCLVPDGSDPPPVADAVSDYVPSARPGHRAPHVPVRLDGRPVSTLDLYDDRFVLLAGPDADVDAGTGDAPGLVVHRIGGEVSDPDGELARTHGIGERGALLVRPDGHVAWRSSEGAGTESVVALLDELLDR